MRAHLVLEGHGVAVAPRPPFALERHGGRGGDAVVVTRRVAGGLPLRLVLAPAAAAAAVPPGRCAVEAGAGVADPAEVARVADGPAAPRWSLRGPGFSLDWPEGFRVESSPAPEAAPGFELTAPGGLLLELHGPLDGEPARPDDHLPPGLRAGAHGEAGRTSWCEVEYRQEQALWRQRAVAVRLGRASVVVTLRAPVASTTTPAWESGLAAAEGLREE